MRQKLLIKNTIISTINQIVTIICGFILPRLILSRFGSDVNGLVSSITQFLGFITFMEMGMGEVVKSSLYEPLSRRNMDQVSRIFVSSGRFFRGLAYILAVYTGILMVVLPFAIGDKFDFMYTCTLVFVISLLSFSQYYFGITSQLLINADQKYYVTMTINVVTVIANTAVAALFIYMGASIQLVKLATSLVCFMRPLGMCLYVSRHYDINKKITYNEEPIKQKWNGIVQNLAHVVANNTDMVVLTLFSTLANVSIYTVYHNVTFGIYLGISTLTLGLTSMLGNVLYAENKEYFQKVFNEVEWAFHFIIVLLYTITGLLIIPFVSVYTSGVDDADYILPLFGVLMTLAQAAYSLRGIYQVLINAAGHYKQTQNSAIVEMIINISVSILLVAKYGVIGVAAGTLLSMVYRTFYYIFYLRNNIICRGVWPFLRHLAIDGIQVAACVSVCLRFIDLTVMGWKDLLLKAVLVSCVCAVICLTINVLFNYRYYKAFLKKYILK